VPTGYSPCSSANAPESTRNSSPSACSWEANADPGIVSQRVVYEACFSDGWVVRCQAITADSLAG